jgi:hypothetical protein
MGKHGELFPMASLRKLSRSPFWYIRYRDVETAVWKDECLKLRHDSEKDTRAARREVMKRSAEEGLVGPTQGEEFSKWVPAYIAAHYTNARSLKRYQHVWERLDEWLRARRIRHPRELKYQHAGEYMADREADGVAHNTARMEVKFLSFLMSEAIRREFAERNSISLARITISAPKEKKELSDADILAARTAFQAEAPWMGRVFEILLHLGCRFAESSIPWERIDFKAGTIQIEDSKRKEGDPKKLFLAPLGAQLAAYLKPLAKKGERTVPPLTGEMNFRFNYRLKQACGATSHSCRVSFISRCHRAGLSETEAMRLVNHSTRMVHRIYSRMSIEDAKRSMLRVPSPPPPLPKTPAPTAGKSSARKKGTRAS